MRHSRALIGRNSGQDSISRVEVLAHHGRLVLEHSEKQRKGHDVQVLVAQVKPVVSRYVSEQVHLPIEVRYGADLAAHVVIEPVERVGIDEAVADPNAGSHALVDLVEDGECVLNSVFGD